MRRFEFRLLPLIFTALGVVVFLRLSWWQWDKANLVQAQTQAYQARHDAAPIQLGGALVDPEAIVHTPVVVRGEYDAESQFLLDNQQENGQPGVHVITPLHIDGTRTRVLVDRGWIGWGASRDQPPQAKPPEGTIEVHGLAQVPSHKKLLFISDEVSASASLVLRLDLPRYAQNARYPVQPIVILQSPDDAHDALVRHWPVPEDKTQMHRGYAVQWLLIALVLVIFFLHHSRRKISPDSPAP